MILIAVIVGYILGIAPFVVPKVLEMKNKGLVVDKKKRDYVTLHRWSTRKRKRKIGLAVKRVCL